MCSYFFSFNEFAQLSVGPPWLAGRTFVVLLIKAAFTEADPASAGWLNRTFCVREVRRGEGLCLFYLFFFFNEFAQVSGHRGWPAEQFFFFSLIKASFTDADLASSGGSNRAIFFFLNFCT